MNGRVSVVTNDFIITDRQKVQIYFSADNKNGRLPQKTSPCKRWKSPHKWRSVASVPKKNLPADQLKTRNKRQNCPKAGKRAFQVSEIHLQRFDQAAARATQRRSTLTEASAIEVTARCCGYLSGLHLIAATAQIILKVVFPE